MRLRGPVGSAQCSCLGPRTATLSLALGTPLPPAPPIHKAAAPVRPGFHTAFIHTSHHHLMLTADRAWPEAGGTLRGLQRDPNIKGESEARGSLRTQERRQVGGKQGRPPRDPQVHGGQCWLEMRL